MTALEECGVDYQSRMVILHAGEQKSPECLAVNPKGKVPVLSIDERLLTENPVILGLLDQLDPAVGLLAMS